MWGTGDTDRDIVGQWKKYLEDLLNLANMATSEKAEIGVLVGKANP